MSSNKSKAALFWVLSVVAVAIGVFVYLVKEDQPGTLPVIELSYFRDEQEVVESISKKLAQNFKQNKHYWLGVEPEKPEHLDIAGHLIKNLKTAHNIQKIIVDQELGLKGDRLAQLGFSDVVPIKENLHALGEKLQELETKGISYIVVSAAIYTSSLLKKNPLNILKEKYNLNPLTISFSYFPTSAEDEKNMMFQCRTDDHTGASDWGCVIINKARFARRKITPNEKPWVGLVDLAGEKDFILLLKKNDR